MIRGDFRKYGIFLLSEKEGFNIISTDDSLFDAKIVHELFDNFNGTNLSKNLFSLQNNGGLEYIVIPNWNNPRWFIPSDNKTIRNIGNLIKPTSFKAKIIWKIALIFNHFNCFSYVFRQKIYIRSASFGKKYLKTDTKSNTFVIYTGAPGIYQKFTIQEMTSTSKIIAFYKFGHNSHAQDRIYSEKNALQLLNKFVFTSFKHPRVLDCYKWDNFRVIKQSPCAPSFEKIILDFNKFHKTSLAEIDSKLNSKRKKSDVLNILKNKIENISKLSNTYNPLVESGIKLSNGFNLLENKLSNLRDLKFSFSHGDFTPWNIFSNGSKLFIFDWEMAEFRMQLWDYFNYIYHSNILTGKFNLNVIHNELNKNMKWALGIVSTEENFEICHLYFLIDISIHYNEHIISVGKNEGDTNLKILVASFNSSLSVFFEKV